MKKVVGKGKQAYIEILPIEKDPAKGIEGEIEDIIPLKYPNAPFFKRKEWIKKVIKENKLKDGLDGGWILITIDDAKNIEGKRPYEWVAFKVRIDGEHRATFFTNFNSPKNFIKRLEEASEKILAGYRPQDIQMSQNTKEVIIYNLKKAMEETAKSYGMYAGIVEVIPEYSTHTLMSEDEFRQWASKMGVPSEELEKIEKELRDREFCELKVNVERWRRKINIYEIFLSEDGVEVIYKGTAYPVDVAKKLALKDAFELGENITSRFGVGKEEIERYRRELEDKFGSHIE